MNFFSTTDSLKCHLKLSAWAQIHRAHAEQLMQKHKDRLHQQSADEGGLDTLLHLHLSEFTGPSSVFIKTQNLN